MPFSKPRKKSITRFDLKDSKSHIELNEKDNKLVLASADEYKLKAVTEILQSKLVKRNVPLKGLSYGVDSARRRINRPAGGYPAARHHEREGQRNRQGHQG